MKKILFAIVAAVLLLFDGFGLARAVPLYLTLEGKIDNSIGDTGLNIGDTITQIWMYDTDVQGYEGTYGDNWFEPFNKISGYGKFYAERLTSGAIEPYYTYADTIDYGSAREGYDDTVFYTGSYYSPTVHTEVWFWNSTIDQLTIGADFSVTEHSYWGSPPTGDRYVHWVGKIEDVSISNPVPEPATMLFFGTGLAGLVGSRIRRKKK